MVPPVSLTAWVDQPAAIWDYQLRYTLAHLTHTEPVETLMRLAELPGATEADLLSLLEVPYRYQPTSAAARARTGPLNDFYRTLLTHPRATTKFGLALAAHSYPSSLSNSVVGANPTITALLAARLVMLPAELTVPSTTRLVPWTQVRMLLPPTMKAIEELTRSHANAFEILVQFSDDWDGTEAELFGTVRGILAPVPTA